MTRQLGREMKHVLTRKAKRKVRHATVFVVIVAILTVLAEVLQFAPFLHSLLAWLPVSLDAVVYWLHLSDAVLFLSGLLYGAGWYVWGRVPTFGRETTVAHLAFVPDAIPPDKYRYRKPADVTELEPFVSFSDKSSAIAGRHPELTGAARSTLYQTWFRRRQEVFLLLDRWSLDNGRWEPVAVSIVLPLSDTGYNRLLQKQVAIIEMVDEIAPNQDPSTKLLLDTWIVKPRRKASAADKIVQVPHEQFGHALPLVHLGMFWNGTARTTLIVEADNPHIRRLCAHVGFDSSRRTKDGAILQVFNYPNDIKDEGDSRPFFRRFSENVERLTRWPISAFRA